MPVLIFPSRAIGHLATDRWEEEWFSMRPPTWGFARLAVAHWLTPAYLTPSLGDERAERSGPQGPEKCSFTARNTTLTVLGKL